MSAGTHTVDKDAISTDEDENERCKNREDKWRVDTDALEPDVDTILRALFDATQNRRINI